MITWKILLTALMMVETGGHHNPSQAIGDGGASVGILQIGKAVVDDVNTFYSDSNYSYQDRYDPEKSREICYKYLTYWGKVYQRKTGKEPTAEIYAKMWNGGCYAWKKEGVVAERLNTYWNKVKGHL